MSFGFAIEQKQQILVEGEAACVVFAIEVVAVVCVGLVVDGMGCFFEFVFDGICNCFGSEFSRVCCVSCISIFGRSISTPKEIFKDSSENPRVTLYFSKKSVPSTTSSFSKSDSGSILEGF